jgi:dodecin
MSVAKVIEILAESNESWEAAAQEAINEAAKTVRNIQSVYIKDFQAIVDDKNVTKYRVNTKITFVVQD